MLSLDQAIDVFMHGFACARSYTHPFEVFRDGDLRWMKDAPGRRVARMEEFIVYRMTAREAHERIVARRPGRYGLAVFDDVGADYQKTKSDWKALGYRVLNSEPMFAKVVTGDGYTGSRVIRVATREQAEVVNKVARRRQMLERDLVDEDPQTRLFAAFDGKKLMGAVRSVKTPAQGNWVSNLFVLPAYRRRGLGTELMKAMLADDAKYGQNSVLLASPLGSVLYPQLGYEHIGHMQFFVRLRPRALLEG